MTNLALTMTRCGAIMEGSYRSISECLRSQAYKEREILITATLVIVLQILDGLFTGIGVSLFGIHAEGNPIIRGLMGHFGPIPALLLVKSVAIAVVFMLVRLSSEVSWIQPALRGVAGIYIVAAIIPWSGILIGHFA